MKRGKRIALEIFGPPFLGIMLAYVFFLISAPLRTGTGRTEWKEQLQVLAVVVAAAYILAGIPSLIYAAIMEWRFSSGLRPHSWRAVGLSSLLGLAAGVAMVGGSIWREQFSPGPAIAFGCLGLVTGFLIGLIIKTRSRPKAE